MVYTPPGVQTTVVIDTTTVTLPGGTRILALLGNGDRVKCISNEAQEQTITRLVTLNASGVNTIGSVFDYSGPGNSKYDYEPSGTGSYGSGFYAVDSTTIGWTPAANPYPTSTTPEVGSTYFASFNYSGSTLSGTTLTESQAHAISTTASGAFAGPALEVSTVIDSVGIIAVYSGATVADGPYQAGTLDVTAGWFQSGTTLMWTNGADADFGTSAAADSIPASGETYYVHYEFAGSQYTQPLVQTTSYSNSIETSGIAPNYPAGVVVINPLIAVSGVNVTYPASGTAVPYEYINGTPVDVSGYGISGTGYNLSGSSFQQAVTWSPTNPSDYGYPTTTVPAISGVFYVSYCYDKQTADYQPKTFAAYSNIVNEYGPEAYWNLITTGTNAGTYTLNRINPLTLGSKVAFNNNASVVVLVQNTGPGVDAGDYLNSVQKLEGKIVDLIVPLTIASGVSFNEMALNEKALALNYVKLHCETMSNDINKKERVGLGSLGPAEIGDSTTPNSYIYTARALNSKRMALIAPGKTSVSLQDPNGNFHDTPIDGAFLATAAAALSASPLTDVATPLTNQELNAFEILDAATPLHPDSAYLDVEKNNMASAGVMIIDQEGPSIFVRHQLTTNQTNVVVGEFSVVTLVDYVSQAVRFSCNPFIGQKLRPASTIPGVKGTILATLQALAAADIISSIGGISVSINPTNPTELLVQAEYVPIFPLNRIRVTFTIKTLGS